MEKQYLPVQIDISEGSVLLVGGGKIAQRKLMYLKDFGAKVVCIAPKILPEIKKMAEIGGITLIEREFRAGDSKGYRYVFAATNNPEADRFIYEDCQKSGALLNVADVPAFCSFILPAYVKRGGVTFSISSGGIAPFFVKHLKDIITDNLPQHFDEIVELAAEFRAILAKDLRYKDEEQRNNLIDKFLDRDWGSIINDYGKDFARAEMSKLFQ